MEVGFAETGRKENIGQLSLRQPLATAAAELDKFRDDIQHCQHVPYILTVRLQRLQVESMWNTDPILCSWNIRIGSSLQNSIFATVSILNYSK